MFYKRKLNLKLLLSQKSHFLFGPRSTGKTSWIKESLVDVVNINLLMRDQFEKYLKEPSRFREELLLADYPKNTTIIIDEIQKVPALLDEVHYLIEEKGWRFLMTGSSARKLKESGVNLLGGRAWVQNFFALSWKEISDFSLEKYLSVGGLPHVYTSNLPYRELKNYISLYLKEEIQQESLVRKLDQFSRFLDSIGLMNAKEVNYQGWGSDIGVPTKTLESYIEILKDTLIAFTLPAYSKTLKRKAIKRPKLYFFDVGVANALQKREGVKPKSPEFGECFEHFLLQETKTAFSYQQQDRTLSYWRSLSQLEVDLCIDDKVAIEFKSSERITRRHLKGLKALGEENIFEKLIVVCMEKEAREVDEILILPYEQYLNKLWEGEF